MTSGLHNILRGILLYRRTVKGKMVEQFKRIRDNPQPKAVFFTCMDSRMMMTRVTQAQVGDMFMVRNAGNMIPHATKYGPFGSEVSVTTEPAAIELGCVRGGIKHVIVCGHSDCKAMNFLYDLHRDPSTFDSTSPLHRWLRRNGHRTLLKYEKVKQSPDGQIEFMSELPFYKFKAYIDSEGFLDDRDKLSQVNVLQQLENIASHQIIQNHIEKGQLSLEAMWFDIYTGEVYFFNKKSGRYTMLDESSIDVLLNEI